MRALLVYPEFREASFWNYRETCRAMGARYPAAPLGLCTVAALLPADWELRLVDRNVEPLEDAAVDWADIVLVGGMIAQQLDSLELVRALRARGKRVVVGGPDATSSPQLYAEADHLVLGEGELTLPVFLEDLARGTPKRRYEDARRADVRVSPVPRFDLLKFERYLHVGVQWSRGCPFCCEFCDVIELLGRVPRTKAPEQLLRELQALYDLGYRGHVDLVDDNFIGNKKLVKQLLPALERWLEERSWPFEFTTEASINLADDPELLGMMQRTGFFAIFVGIETPDDATLLAAHKAQNARRSLARDLRTIYRHGIFVNSGFVLGFDGEQGSVARALIDCIEATAIPVNMVGLLAALPGTQLARRLAAEGRLRDGFDVQPEGVGDQCLGGLNFETRRPRAEILRDYLEIVETTYAPRAYFARTSRVARELDSSRRRFRPPLRAQWRELRAFVRIARSFRPGGGAFVPFWRALVASLVRNPRSIRYAASMMALYAHFGPFSRYLAGRLRVEIAREERSLSAAGATARQGAELAPTAEPAGS
jgi:radical SAM superfamily enzyme YgiQ (UPF0313 family)